MNEINLEDEIAEYESDLRELLSIVKSELVAGRINPDSVLLSRGAGMALKHGWLNQETSE